MKKLNNDVEDEGGVAKDQHSNNRKHTSNGSNCKPTGKVGKGDGHRRRHSSQESEVSVESMEEYIPTPPDGGWGWVIVFSSMIANLIVDGIGYSFGVFLVEFAEAFEAPKSKISLVGSLLCGTYLFAGPIVSAMTNRFGCRPVVIAGSCLATAGFVLARFSPSVDMLIITYGVIGGFGLGMIYLPSIVSVGYYFEKKRAFATGLAVCGSGIGTFMFPPLSEFLLAEYSWQGGLLIIAGIIFHGCVCGVLMRPLQAKPAPKANRKPRAKNFMDRLKETTHARDRSISESIAANSAPDNNKILERLMAAKMQREKRLQDNDSDLGSLPSIAFVKRMDSLGTGDHRRVSGGMLIPVDPRKHKLSVSSTAESASSTIRDIPGSPSSHVMGSPETNTPKIVLEEKKLSGEEGGDGKISPDPGIETKPSDIADFGDINDETSTERSDYFTPPVSPVVTSPNSPAKDLMNSEEVMKNEEHKKFGHKTANGIHQQYGSEVAPLLEVPAPIIRHRGSHSVSHGGSRTNMMHLQSLGSLHISKKDLARPLYRKDIFYSGSILNIPQYNSQPDMKSYITSITTIPGEMEFLDGPSPSWKCINKCCSCLPRSARDVLSEMVDVSLLKDISFMLICVGNITAFLGFFVPFMFLVDQAASLGVEKTKAAFLISVIGITNTVGRVLIGKLADLRIVDSLVITYVSIAVCGLVTALIPFCLTYPLLAANAAIFGLGMAAFISLSSIIICDRMGLEKLTNAFGLLSMVRGISGMVGPPLAGFMYDSSGSYDLSFYVGGLLLFAGAACHILLHLPCLRPVHVQETVMEEALGEGGMEFLGSKPQIVTVEEALSSV